MIPPLPEVEQLLDLERQVRRGGTLLQAVDLVGRWQLRCVWPKRGGRPAAFSGWLLRGLGARLEITAQAGELRLRNAVQLGSVELRFDGCGQLQGRRPLLLFSFDQLTLSLAGRPLLQRRLPAPPSRRQPFFALIRRDSQGWLAARGRGGGLALWQLADPA